MRNFILRILVVAGLLMLPMSQARVARAVIGDLSQPKISLAAREVGRFLRHFDEEHILPQLLSSSDAARADDIVRLTMDADALGRESYVIEQGSSPGELLVRGGSDQALLYASYRLAELLGVRFSLAGEAVPAAATAGWINHKPLALGLASVLPVHDSPVFETRGLQPFHVRPAQHRWPATHTQSGPY